MKILDLLEVCQEVVWQAVRFPSDVPHSRNAELGIAAVVIWKMNTSFGIRPIAASYGLTGEPEPSVPVADSPAAGRR